jgi:hypothetical protein
MRNILIASLVVISAAAVAEPNLATKERRKQGQSYIDLELKSIAKECGVGIDASIDWDSFKFDDKHGEPAAGGMCRSALSQVSYLCRRGGDYKAAVVKKIKHVDCSYADTEGYSLNGGTFHAGFNFKNVNIGDRALKALNELL